MSVSWTVWSSQFRYILQQVWAQWRPGATCAEHRGSDKAAWLARQQPCMAGVAAARRCQRGSGPALPARELPCTAGATAALRCPARTVQTALQLPGAACEAAAWGGRRNSATARPTQTARPARPARPARSAGAQDACAAAAAAGRNVAGPGYNQWWSHKIRSAAAPAEDRRRSCGGF